MWLKQKNPIYGDINVDRHQLEELPENNIPKELLSVVKEGDDEESLEKERESYLIWILSWKKASRLKKKKKKLKI